MGDLVLSFHHVALWNELAGRAAVPSLCPLSCQPRGDIVATAGKQTAGEFCCLLAHLRVRALLEEGKGSFHVHPSLPLPFCFEQTNLGTPCASTFCPFPQTLTRRRAVPRGADMDFTEVTSSSTPVTGLPRLRLLSGLVCSCLSKCHSTGQKPVHPADDCEVRRWKA